MIRTFSYDVASLRCLPNLRSVSLGQNMNFIPMCGENVICGRSALINSVSHVEFARFSYLRAYQPLAYGMCNNDVDKSMDDYFIDESVVEYRNSSCTLQKSQSIPQPLFKCTRVVEANHVNLNFGFPTAVLLSYDIASEKSDTDNPLEVIDFSQAALGPDGLRFSNFASRGLKKLRLANMSYLNIRYIHNFTFTDTENMEYMDLSGNDLWGDMDAEHLSLMLSTPVLIKNINFSSCSIEELKDNFLWQFPQLNSLDLSNNKLSKINLNLSLSFPKGIRLNLGSNKFISLNDSFTRQLDNNAAVNKSVTININNNPFRCDCDTISFIRWFRSTRVTIENKMSIICSYRGITERYIIDVNYDDLSTVCQQLIYNIKLIACVVVGLILIAIFGGIIAFKYRWHIRWRWYVTKRMLFKKQEVKTDGYGRQKEFVCFISHLGINDKGIIKELVTQIEEMSGETALLYEKNAMPGGTRDGFITEAIMRSRKLIFFIGSNVKTEDVNWFEFTLRMACVDRALKMSDIVILCWNEIPYESFNKSLVKWLFLPESRSGVRLVQHGSNAMVWEELKEALQLNIIESVRPLRNSEEIVIV